jgi:hypothetical protein
VPDARGPDRPSGPDENGTEPDSWSGLAPVPLRPEPAAASPPDVGETGIERRRRWWAPLPLPPLPFISVRRAYTEVLSVFAVFFLAGILGAGLLLAGRYRNPLQNGNWSDYGPAIIDVLAQTVLAIAVVLLLSARRGVTAETLGLSLPHRRDGRFAAGQATRILAWAIFAQVLGGILNAALQTGHLPTSQPNAAELTFSFADSIQAGVVEELVVLAFVVVTLRQARRGWWEITLVALVLRGSYHIYYGPGVLGILVWAALFYWIYLRFRSLILLMVCHAGWDAVGFFSQRWPAVAGGAVIVAVAIWLAAPITWLVERNDPRFALEPAWYPESRQLVSTTGWQPDPAPGRQFDPASGWQPDPVPGRQFDPASGWQPDPVPWRQPDPASGRQSYPDPAWLPDPASGSQFDAASAWQPDPGAVAQPEPAAGWQSGLPPAGWQPDPAGMHYWRWWDGRQWTEYVSGP